MVNNRLFTIETLTNTIHIAALGSYPSSRAQAAELRSIIFDWGLRYPTKTIVLDFNDVTITPHCFIDELVAVIYCKYNTFWPRLKIINHNKSVKRAICEAISLREELQKKHE